MTRSEYLRKTRAHVGWLLGVGAILAIAARIWWVSPEELEPGPLLSSARLLAGDYRLVPKTTLETRGLIRAEFFEGYDPNHHSEFEETLKDRPSRYVREDSRHHYIEYLGRFGRIQLHSAYDSENGFEQWFEFFPTRIAVDEFFAPGVAIILDARRPKYSVAILDGREHSYMTVRVADRQVLKVVWLSWYGKTDD